MNFLITITAFLFCHSVASAADCKKFAGQFTCVDEYGDSEIFVIGFPSENIIESGDGIASEKLTFDKWTKLKDDQDLAQREGIARCLTDHQGVSQLSIEYNAIDLDRHGRPSGALSWRTDFELAKQSLSVHTLVDFKPKIGEKIQYAGEFSCVRGM